MKKFFITILVFVFVQINTTATIINPSQNQSNKLQNSTINFNIKVFKNALNNNDTVVLNNIIESGIDPNSTKFGRTILSYAISSGNIYAVEKLLKAGADANKLSRGVTPLNLAIKDKQPKIVEMLINSGADVNKTNTVQFLNNSIYDGCVNSIIILDPALKPITPEYTPLIPTMNVISPTPIFFAIKTGQLNIVVMLIKAGANLSYVNQGGLNPLDYAICLNQADIVEKLIETGAIASSAIYVEHAKNSRNEKIKALDIPLFYKKPVYKNVNFYIQQK